MYMVRSLLIFSYVIFKMTAWRPYWIFRFLDSIGGMFLERKSSLLLNFKFHMLVDCGNKQKPIDFSVPLLSKWLPGSHIGFLGFQTLTLVRLWISTPNFSGAILIYMGRSLLIFSDVNFKMAVWQPCWIFLFPDSNFSLALNINSKLQWQSTYVYG